VPADLVASVQTDAPTAAAAPSGAALADGQEGNTGSSGSPNSDPEEGYIAPAGPQRRFSRIEDMVRELDRQAGESSASSRPVAAESRVAGPRLGTPAAIAQPPAPAPAPADVPRENIAALVQGIRIQLRQGISEATVRLQPEHFGEVTIAVRLEKGMVSAQVRAEASGVCDWLAGQEESIRSNLSEHGLQLDRFVVQRDRPRERRETPQQSNRPRARQVPDAEQPRFEVAA
jgi:flagellar hook-length control protein FliK